MLSIVFACVQCADVEFVMDAAAVGRLTKYFEEIGQHLPRSESRASFATYFYGLLGDGERKSVEPMATRACADPADARNAHDRLLHFVGHSPWSDRAVRTVAARYAIAAMQRREPVTTWIIDDTGFPKQGTHSVGVQRQYSGTLGKIAYEEMKQELGLDHYEGRSLPGWNHHISVVLSCYAFVAAERLRRFSPSATWVRPPRPNRSKT